MKTKFKLNYFFLMVNKNQKNMGVETQSQILNSRKQDVTVDIIKFDDSGNGDGEISFTERLADIIGNDIDDDNDNNNFPSYSKWLQESENTFFPSTDLKILDKIPGGIYTIEFDRQRSTYFLNKTTPVLDDLLFLPDPKFDDIVKDMVYFWDNEQLFKDYNYAYKRGLLLYGEPGCGKTSLTSLLSKVVVEKYGGVVISIRDGDDLHDYKNFIGQIFRAIEKNTPLLVLIEDLDGLLAYGENETTLLNVLDGVDQAHNVVYIGCTNYPEDLKERVINRPSRFDKRYHIGLPNETVRRFYLENKINNNDKKTVDMDFIVKETDGLSLAHLGEFVKMVFIFKADISETITNLKDMSKYVSSTNYEGSGSSGIGFGSNKKKNNR